MTRLQYFSLLLGVISAIMVRPSHTWAQQVIDYNTTITQPGENIRVIRGNNPDPPTTVNVDIAEGHHLSGIDAFDSSVVNVLNGSLSGEDSVAHDTATINARGGTIEDGLITLDSGTINIYGGHLDGAELDARDSGAINVYGADFGRDGDQDGANFYADNLATVNFHGGFTGYVDVRAAGSSSLNFFDGYFEDITVSGSSKSQIYGGTFTEDFEAHDSSEIDVWGGSGLGIEAWDRSSVRVFDGSLVVGATNASSVRIFGGHSMRVYAGTGSSDPSSATVTVYGKDFNYPYGPIPDTDGTLTGTLSSGDKIHAAFTIRNGASIVLQVPEPSSAILLAMAALWCFLKPTPAARLQSRSKQRVWCSASDGGPRVLTHRA